MSIQIKTLNNIGIRAIHKTFVQAFSDYQVDMSYMTEDVLLKRFIKNGYRPDLSAGIFDGDHLKGFTVVGSGSYNGERSAFDIMTGLVKDYRGMGHANRMFDLILNKMKEQSIQQFYLEVLQANKPAISAYSKTGFHKKRGFKCYALKVGNLHPAKTIQSIIFIDQAEPHELDTFLHFLDWEPSWENHFESIKRIPDEVKIIVARAFGRSVGLCVYYPTLKWILSLAVDPAYRRKGVATALLEYLIESLPLFVREVKLMNVQDDDLAMQEFLKVTGFELLTGQYEMIFRAN